jgi:DNA modification methylase
MTVSGVYWRTKMHQREKEINDKYFHESPFAARGFHNFDTSAQLPRHRWYYFKEGFSAALVEEAIKSVSDAQERKIVVLDPFCGSGTTPLATSLLGHHCTGIEVNPFLAFVSRVKSTPRKWQRPGFVENLDEIISLSETELISPLESFSTFGEREGLTKWLFNRDVLRKFASLVGAIDAATPAHHEAFTLAAIVSAFDCSNAKRDGKGLRYKPNWQQRKYSGNDVLDSFKKHALVMIDDVEKFPIDVRNEPRIINADSRKALGDLKKDSVDLVVTSPPYLNSFDYSDVYRPELFLGSYVSDNKGLTKIRLNTIRSHVQVDWPRETSVECSLLTPILQKLDEADNLWNLRIPLMVKAYFDDLNQVIKNVALKLKRQGQIWMVVSTSAYGGVHIPVDLIIAELANDAGFTLEGIHRLRDLRASGQQWKQFNTKRLPLRESLIILTKA